MSRLKVGDEVMLVDIKDMHADRVADLAGVLTVTSVTDEENDADERDSGIPLTLRSSDGRLHPGWYEFRFALAHQPDPIFEGLYTLINGS